MEKDQAIDVSILLPYKRLEVGGEYTW